MKRVLFFVSHIGSGWENVVKILEEHPRIQFHQLAAIFRHPIDLETLVALPHKDDTTAAIYGTVLLHNDAFAGRSLYKCCKFIYFIRRPRPTLTEIISKNLYNTKTAIDYYIFRIQRIYEMVVQTPNAILLTSGKVDLGLVERYLNLKIPFNSYSEQEAEDLLPQSYVADAEDAYENILYKIKKLNLNI